MVGLIPLFAVEVLDAELLDAAAGVRARGCDWFLDHRPDLARAGLALERAGRRTSGTCCRCCAATG